MNNQSTYKRVKINWWVFIIFGGIHAWMIFAYIRQWGNNPIDKVGLIILSIIWIFVYSFIGRFKVIIDENYAIFRTDLWIPVKIPILMIKKICVKPISLMDLYKPDSITRKYQFDFFASYAIRIQMQNGKNYQINTKNAQKIKEEIEKRMITTSI